MILCVTTFLNRHFRTPLGCYGFYIKLTVAANFGRTGAFAILMGLHACYGHKNFTQEEVRRVVVFVWILLGRQHLQMTM